MSLQRRLGDMPMRGVIRNNIYEGATNFVAPSCIGEVLRFLLPDFRKTLLNILDYIINIFKTYRESYHTGINSCRNELFVA